MPGDAPRNFSLKGRTRWQELRETVESVIEIACCFDEDGVDVFFLNRPPVLNVTSKSQLNATFSNPPRGYTPLCQALRDTVQKKMDHLKGDEKKLLIIVCTDGQPTDREGRSDSSNFRSLLENVVSRPDREIRVGFLACTDDDDVMRWLNSMDEEVRHVDVTDDFYSEREEVLRAGRVRSFNRNDWLIKMLLGAADDKWDKLDEGNSGNPSLLDKVKTGVSENCALM